MRVSDSTSEPARRRRGRAVAAALTAALVALSVTQVVQGADAAPAALAQAAPVAGAQTSGDSLFPNQGNGGYDVSHMGLDLAYAATGSITATATITAATTGAPLSSYSLDLEGLTVTSVKVDGATAAFARSEVTSADAKLDKHKLVITPATPVSGTFTTVVAYSGTPIQHSDPDDAKEGWTTTPTGAVALGQPVGTMTFVPCNDHPGDKATWTARLTIPTVGPANNAVFNGTMVSKVANPAPALTTTFTWDQPNPMAAELAIVAIGNYNATAADLTLAGGRTIQERSFLNPALAAVNESARAKQTSVIDGIQARYGAYPGAAAGIVVDSTTLGYALETQDRPYFEGAIDDNTLIHEFTHQWYGDAVSPADWNDIWLNEGPATFVATQVAHDMDPTATDTETEYYGLWNATAATSPDWKVPPAGMTDGSQLFGWQVYNRGAMTLEALRTATCQDTLQQIMATDVARNRGTSRRTSTFIDEAEEISGRDLGAFFQDWIYDADKPAWPAKYTLGLTSAPASGSTVTQGDTVAYTLSAANTGKVSMTGKVVTVDVSSLGGRAAVDTASLPAGVTLSGTTLTWAVPTTAVGVSATTTFEVVISSAADGGPLALTARSATLGTCDTPTSTITVDGPVPTASPSPTSPTTSPTPTPTATATQTATAGPTTPSGTGTPAPNHAPTARGTVSPMVVYVGQPVHLDARRSTDPETAASGLTYRWDFGNAGTTLDAATSTATAHYRGRGMRTITLRVTDPAGATSTAAYPIIVLKRVACESGAVHRHGFQVVRLARAPGGAYCTGAQHSPPGADVTPVTLDYDFTGSSLRIAYGRRADGGRAQVYVDGRLRGTLNSHSTSHAITFPRQLRYFGGLGPSRHHLRIVPADGTAFVDSISF